MIVLVSYELFAVVNSHNIIHGFSYLFLLLRLREAVLACFCFTLFEIKLDSRYFIPIPIPVEDQLLWICDTVQFSEQAVKISCNHFTWLVKSLFVFFCALVNWYFPFIGLICIPGLVFCLIISCSFNSFDGFKSLIINYPKCDVEAKPVFLGLNSFCVCKHILV